MLDYIGRWKIYPIESGEFRLDGGAMMGSVPKVLWDKTNPADELNRIDLSLRCLLLVDSEKCILIETGLGDSLEDDFIEMFHIVQPKKPLKEKLNNIGFKMEDITDVILTHLHFDHAGGATTYRNSKFIPAFPNANYYISNTNWRAGLNPSSRDRASYLKNNYLPLKEYGKLKILPENCDIMDGISTLIVNGHTFGQQLIKIESEGDVMVFCADLIPLKSHLKLPWIMGYDLNAILTLEEKTIFLKEAAENKWWLWFYHDPETIAVKIEKGEKYYNIIKEVKRGFTN
tara:strand:+ start:203 stop:1063 length:861 start_codon:yes stop_codon:yes gene_type:complete